MVMLPFRQWTGDIEQGQQAHRSATANQHLRQFKSDHSAHARGTQEVRTGRDPGDDFLQITPRHRADAHQWPAFTLQTDGLETVNRASKQPPHQQAV